MIIVISKIIVFLLAGCLRVQGKKHTKNLFLRSCSSIITCTVDELDIYSGFNL